MIVRTARLDQTHLCLVALYQTKTAVENAIKELEKCSLPTSTNSDPTKLNSKQ
jgi:hypothetical protein